MAREKRPTYQISDVSGQVVIGEGNVTAQGSTVDGSATGADATALAERLGRLRERVDEVADGAETERAKERGDEVLASSEASGAPRAPGVARGDYREVVKVSRQERWDFFIAYASPDQMAAETLYDLLSSSFRVFLDCRNLLPGDDWSSRLSAEQSLAAVTLVLVSSRTDSAYYQREEIARAIELARHTDDLHLVVPILLDEPADAGQLPYGLRLKQAISVTEAGGLSGVADRLKSALQYRMAMSASEIQQRYTNRAVVERAVRLVPRQGFDPNGLLGLPSRAYVFVGDHDEQRHRTLRQILSNLWIGDAFEQVNNSNIAWSALIFEVGELNHRKLDLLPATWKAAFRILSDPKRAACFAPTEEELTRLGRPPRDYYSDDQRSWYSSCTKNERRWTEQGELVKEALGISWTCFSGTGITNTGIARQPAGIPSRVFFVKNLPLSSITYQVQDLGMPNDDAVLD